MTVSLRQFALFATARISTAPVALALAALAMFLPARLPAEPLSAAVAAGPAASAGAEEVTAEEVAAAENAAEADGDSGPLAHPRAAVRLASGRTFVAFVDARTDDATLWLRFEHGRSTLWRPIVWRRVIDVSIAGETYSGEELRAVAGRYATKEAASRRTYVTTAAAMTPPPVPEPPAVDGLFADAGTRGSVRSLAVDVRLANWDADPQDDGLVAYVTPLDEAGQATAAAGTLTVELIGMTGPRRPTWSITSRGKDDQRPVLETWTVQLAAEDFAAIDGSATVRLPFRGGEPAENPHLRSLGAVRARLVVPGSDVVEAIVDPVRLRPLGKIGVVGR